MSVDCIGRWTSAWCQRNQRQRIAPVQRQLANLLAADGHTELRVGSVDRFTAGSDDIVRSTLDGERPDLVKPIVPEKGCHFLTKARHSVFYATPLDYLLGRLDTKRLILTGQVTEQYILYSALDAYVRISPSWYRRMRSPTSTPTSVMPRCA